MAAKILELITGGTRKRSTDPNPELIKLIEAVLELAKEGRVQSLLGTAFTPDGKRLAIWGDTHPNACEVLGAIKLMEIEYIARHPEAVLWPPSSGIGQS